MIDEDAAHDLRCYGYEVSAALPLQMLLASNQLHVRLIDQRGGLQSVIGTLAGHVAHRDAMELGINERDQVGLCLAIALAKTVEDLSYFSHRVTHRSLASHNYPEVLGPAGN